MTHQLSMRALFALAIDLTLLCTGCASRISPPSILPTVTALDNLNGASRPSVASTGDGVVRIEVASRVGECVLREFLVKPSERALHSQARVRSERPQEFQADRAIYHFKPSEPTTIIAQYVHTVVVESGSRSEPEGESDTTGSGEMQAGRVLLNGYRFDHYDFSSNTTGPGGASASVKEAPRQGGEQTYLRIRWSYDPYSRVSFSWKIYGTGPCDGSP